MFGFDQGRERGSSEFWRTGELAVLTGQSGVGKSLLATQIAEVIARGAQDSINGLPTTGKPLRVIYFDFERLPDQFSRLYSCRPYPNPLKSLVRGSRFCS